jgi:antitoxin MazE
MKTAAQKWGNSLAIRIPGVYAKEIGLTPGAAVDLEIKAGKLVISPRLRPRYSLKELLAQVKKSNLHSEIDWGRSEGSEVW